MNGLAQKACSTTLQIEGLNALSNLTLPHDTSANVHPFRLVRPQLNEVEFQQTCIVIALIRVMICRYLANS